MSEASGPEDPTPQPEQPEQTNVHPPSPGLARPASPWADPRWADPRWSDPRWAGVTLPAARRRHRTRPVAAAILVVAAGAASVGIGHVVWPTSASGASVASSPAATSPAVTSPATGGSGSSSNPSYSGLPSGSGSGLGSGQSGSSSGSTSGSGAPSDVSSIAAKVDPGLVDIDTAFGYQSAEGAGTGIVLTSTGEILTNNHVINGATSIRVTDVGNGRTYDASVVGYDSSNDIAVLQLKDASGLTTANIANSADVKVGEAVVAIGNAGGTGGTPTAAGGSVTALDQAITASDELDGTSEQLSGLIEVNADVQSGDSGGSLVNAAGKVIGIDSAAASGYSLQSSSSQGYAIPINQAISIADQIEAGRSSSVVHIGTTAFLGVLISSSSNQGYGGSNVSGASISGVVSGGAASAAGLAAGDVITSLDGSTVDSPTALSSLIAGYHPGQSVTIGWTDSSGATHTATVVLGSGPPS